MATDANVPAIDSRIAQLQEALLSLDSITANQILAKNDEGRVSYETIETVVMPALMGIGEKWAEGELALAEVYMSGRLCMGLIGSPSVDTSLHRDAQPRVGIAVLIDSHVLGKQIVSQLLLAAGYELIDLGTALSVEQLVEAVIAQEVDVVMISVLMLTSALAIKEVRAGLDAAGYQATLVVGGAPFRFDPELYRTVHADYGAKSASDALVAMASIEAAAREAAEEFRATQAFPSATAETTDTDKPDAGA